MLINIIGFNLSWFGLVYWGNIFTPIALMYFASHLLNIANLKSETLLILIIVAIGISVDSFLHWYNFFIFPNSNHFPFWLMVLWLCFSTTISHSLRFLAASKSLQIVAGGIFAPLSYLAAVKLNAVELGQSVVQTYVVLSVIWALLFIVFFYFKSIFFRTKASHV
jgi:hypothetical protein